MPSKNIVKQYLEGGHYHVYNRGVEKRRVFLDDQDYRVFLHLLKYYLSAADFSEEHPLKELTGFVPVRPRPLEPLYNQVELLCYCLMPNHFHLLMRQKSQYGMAKLMRRLSTTYAMYFNRRYDRVGPLFQSRYKAALVENDEQLLHLSRYIHQNPTLTKGFLNQYPYSSYSYYIGEQKGDWLKLGAILKYFNKTSDISREDIKRFQNYKEFVENYEKEPEQIIDKLLISKD